METIIDMREHRLVAELMLRLERLAPAAGAFLTPDELAVLTGRKSKSRQIVALRAMAMPFFVNGVGRAVVARAAVEGGKAPAGGKPKWAPAVLGKG